MLNPVISYDEIIGLRMASFNVMKRKPLEMDRQKMLKELIDRNKKMEEFAAIVSHNLRAPLSNILGLSNILTKEITKTAEKYIANGIKASAEKMDEVIKELNQILYYQSTFSEQKSTVNLQTLIKNIEHDFKASIFSTNARIEYDFKAVNKLTTIPSFIQNIFANLLSNSLKFHNPEVTPLIRIWIEKIPGNVVIHFQDNDMGLDLAIRSSA